MNGNKCTILFILILLFLCHNESMKLGILDYVFNSVPKFNRNKYIELKDAQIKSDLPVFNEKFSMSKYIYPI